MKILLCFPMKDGQTGPAIKTGFERLGHKVEVVDAKVNPKDSYPKAQRFQPDLVFCSRTVQLTEPMRRIKEDLNPVTCMWNVDTRDNIKKWQKLFPLLESCDYHFVVNDYHTSEWVMRHSPKTFWLPQGLQDETYDKPEEILDKDIEKYACDVSFAGYCERAASWRKKYIRIARNTGAKVKVWGGDAKNKVYGEEHNKMVWLSKINLGVSRLYRGKVKKYTSVRNYKIQGAGGFLLELWRPGLYDVFPPGTLDSYKNEGQLKHKIDYWLEHEKERKETAERGYKWVKENATYTHRMKRALELMKL